VLLGLFLLLAMVTVVIWQEPKAHFVGSEKLKAVTLRVQRLEADSHAM